MAGWCVIRLSGPSLDGRGTAYGKRSPAVGTFVPACGDQDDPFPSPSQGRWESVKDVVDVAADPERTVGVDGDPGELPVGQEAGGIVVTEGHIGRSSPVAVAQVQGGHLVDALLGDEELAAVGAERQAFGMVES